MSGEKHCYWEEGKAQRKCFSYQRQHLAGEQALASWKKEFFSTQSNMNTQEQKKNQVKSTDMTMAHGL